MSDLERSSTSPAVPFDGFPFSFVQQSSRAAAVVMVLLLLPVISMIVVPFTLVVALAGADLQHAFAEKPLAVSGLVSGLFAWAGFFLVPAQKIIRRFWSTRSVRIAAHRVTVHQAGLVGARLWTAPLSDFAGIAHRMRATLSGVRHELLLVHRDPRRTVLLHAADRICQATIDRACALFQLPQLPAGALHGLPPPPLQPLARAQPA
jgi:hypothetical protein